MLIVLFAAPLLLGYAIGLLIARVVSSAVVTGKIRNVSGAGAIGIVAGLVGFVIYLFMSYYVFGTSSIQTFYDVLVSVEFLLGIVYSAYKHTGAVVNQNPFCELCEEYVDSKRFENIPIRYEDDLINMALSSNFGNMARLVSTSLKDSKNYCEITVWHCSSCGNQGFINIETTQTRYTYSEDGSRTEKSEDHLMYSSKLDGKALRPFLEVQTS